MDAIAFVELCFKTEELKLPNKLIRLGYVKFISDKKVSLDNLELTRKGVAFLAGTSYVEDLEWITKEYRQRFKECNPLKFGDKSECERKVIKIMNANNASKEDVLMAVDCYIQSLQGDYSNNMMSSADYFASYTDKLGHEKSKLAQYLELSKDPSNSWSNRV